MFADQTTTLKNRRQIIASTLGLAALPTAAMATAVNPSRPVPSAVARLAREWAAVTDRVKGLDADAIDGMLATIEDVHTRLRDAMREAGIVAIVVDGKLVVDSWAAENVPDQPKFGTVVIGLATVAGL